MNKLWLWPVLQFWTFTPCGWLLAVAWNICELFHIRMLFGPWVFGVIIGRKGTKVSRESHD